MVLKKTYKGNTLPEVLIAIVIISFASAMGVNIYINIQQNTQPFLKLKASELAEHYLRQTEEKREYLDQQYKEEEFSVKRTITHSDQYPDCILVNISVSHQSEKKICELQKLIHAD
jgi:prepilin-type N-terminal cleavage/methylation domain-containing protein